MIYTICSGKLSGNFKAMKELNKRLKKLNTIIDRKIVQGLDYKKEAKEHKDILYFIKLNA